MEWLTRFPQVDDRTLRAWARTIDMQYREFSRSYGTSIEAFFRPLLDTLLWLESFLLGTPWIVILVALVAIVWFGSRSRPVTLLAAIAFSLIGLFGMWTDAMRTLAIIIVCTLLAIGIGLPLGILMSRSRRLRAVMTPVLDVMQTMPPFVYLIPIVMLLGIGLIPGVIVVVVYAMPPIIRLTDLGLRLVDPDILEAADAFGTSRIRKLFEVELPLALPNIMAGINQTIMMALAMVVVASLIGVRGLGQPVLQAITNQYFTQGVLNGLAIVAIAIVFDRTSQAYGRRLQAHRNVRNG